MRSLFGRALLAAAVLIPSSAVAELRRAEFKLEGMDCVYCNGAMSTAVKKLDGVESVDLAAGKGTIVIHLKADNKITLLQLRRTIKSVGYDARNADITARGRIAPDGGSFDLLNGSTLHLAAGTRGPSHAIIEVAGVATPGEKDTDVLSIATIK